MLIGKSQTILRVVFDLHEFMSEQVDEHAEENKDVGGRAELSDSCVCFRQADVYVPSKS